ncbi:restriction endonuclease subunit S [Kineococcus sp. TBRC 1896]|uniref:Restriction endonuclease subunit S n=1 Tax=Kineococcus mangrovi TaxID=1660183 RepID=A0ABV4HZB8_9ACTN
MTETFGRATTLGNLCEEGGGGIQTGPFGSQLHASDYTVEGIPVVMPVNIGDNRVVEANIARVSQQDADRLSKYRLTEGDIIYSRRGDVERRALVRSDSAGWLCGTGCLRVRLGDHSPHDNRFISYLLGTANVREWIVRHAVGATMANLNTSILGSVPLDIPEPRTQHAIADVLGALDDKIVSNQHAATVAESVLSSQFRSLGLDSEPAANEWVVSEIFDLNPPRPKPHQGPAVYLDMASLPNDGMVVTEWSERPPTGGARFINGDTLLARITPCLENGKCGYVNFLPDGNVGVGSTEYIVMRSKADFPLELSYFLAKSPRFTAFAIQQMVGSSGRQRLSAKDLADYPLSIVGRDAMATFGRRAAPTSALLRSYADENTVLAALRDTLLPALTSGRLRVRDAEKLVEDAT